METTSSAAIVNNNLISIVLNLNLNVVVNLFIYAAATTTGVTIMYKLLILAFEQIMKIIEYKWITRYKDKRTLSVDVIKICNEGSTNDWTVRQRNIEHVYFISRLLERQDEKARELFDKMNSSWSLNSIHQRKHNTYNEDIVFGVQLREKAQKACDELMKIVNKWK